MSHHNVIMKEKIDSLLSLTNEDKENISLNEKKELIYSSIINLESDINELYHIYKKWDVTISHVLESSNYDPLIAKKLRSLYTVFRDMNNDIQDASTKIKLTMNSFSGDLSNIGLEIKNLENILSNFESKVYGPIHPIEGTNDFNQELFDNTNELFSYLMKCGEKASQLIPNVSSFYHSYMLQKLKNDTISSIFSLLPDNLGMNLSILGGIKNKTLNEGLEQPEIEGYEEQPIDKDIEHIWSSSQRLYENITALKYIYNEWDLMVDKELEHNNYTKDVVKDYRNMYKAIRDQYESYIDTHKLIHDALFSFQSALWDDDDTDDPKGYKLKLENMLSMQEMKINQIVKIFNENTNFSLEFKERTNEFISDINRVFKMIENTTSDISCFYNVYVIPKLKHDAVFSTIPLLFDAPKSIFTDILENIPESMQNTRQELMINKMVEVVSCFDVGADGSEINMGSIIVNDNDANLKLTMVTSGIKPVI